MVVSTRATSADTTTTTSTAATDANPQENQLNIPTYRTTVSGGSGWNTRTAMGLSEVEKNKHDMIRKSEITERIEQMCRQGMKYADIGKELGMEENAVKMAVKRAGLKGVAKGVRRERFVAMAAEYYRNYGRVTLKELAASLGVNPKTLSAHVYQYRKEAMELLRKEAELCR